MSNLGKGIYERLNEGNIHNYESLNLQRLNCVIAYHCKQLYDQLGIKGEHVEKEYIKESIPEYLIEMQEQLKKNFNAE
jgi:hypothetical protein